MAKKDAFLINGYFNQRDDQTFQNKNAVTPDEKRQIAFIVKKDLLVHFVVDAERRW